MPSLDLPPQITAFLAQSGRSDGALWAIKLSITTAVRKVSLPVCYKPAPPHVSRVWLVSQTFPRHQQRVDLTFSHWCIPSPDKQQKGEFNIEGYSVKMNSSLRKDSKKDFCFEISASDKRSYMVGLCPCLSWPQHFIFMHMCSALFVRGNALHSPQIFSWTAVLCIISERGRGMGEADRLCFERSERFVPQSALSSAKFSFTKTNGSDCSARRYDGHHSWRRGRGTGTVWRCRADGWDLRSAPRSNQTYVVLRDLEDI